MEGGKNSLFSPVTFIRSPVRLGEQITEATFANDEISLRCNGVDGNHAVENSAASRLRNFHSLFVPRVFRLSCFREIGTGRKLSSEIISMKLYCCVEEISSRRASAIN